MKTRTTTLVAAAMIAAIYTAVTLLLAPISYGLMQVRLSEALTVLAAYSPTGVLGVTLGCLLANIIGFMSGANLLGAMDILFGTAATLIAAVLSYLCRGVRVRGIPVLSPLFPVVVNAIVIGGELYIVMTPAGEFLPGVFFTHALWVGLGQLISCYGLGLPLCVALKKTGLDKKLLKTKDIGK